MPGLPEAPSAQPPGVPVLPGPAPPCTGVVLLKPPSDALLPSSPGPSPPVAPHCSQEKGEPRHTLRSANPCRRGGLLHLLPQCLGHFSPHEQLDSLPALAGADIPMCREGTVGRQAGAGAWLDCRPAASAANSVECSVHTCARRGFTDVEEMLG